MIAELSSQSAKRRHQQQQDQRRMQFRRAIEDYAQQRQLSQELAEHPELITADYLIAAHAAFR